MLVWLIFLEHHVLLHTNIIDFGRILSKVIWLYLQISAIFVDFEWILVKNHMLIPTNFNDFGWFSMNFNEKACLHLQISMVLTDSPPVRCAE